MDLTLSARRLDCHDIPRPAENGLCYDMSLLVRQAPATWTNTGPMISCPSW
ncbi:hypothetical protein RSAG8_09218, partial [Rhizoctonia solani AG-8 WAC10335]